MKTRAEKIVYPILLLILLFRVLQFWPLDPKDKFSSQISLPFLEQTKTTIHIALSTLFPSPDNILIEGIIFGAKNNLPKDLTDSLKRTSTIHIVVASGQNLTILIGFFQVFNYLIGRRKTIFLSFGVIILYSILTGLQIPIIRAAIMMFFSLLAKLIGRESVGWKVLLLTGYCMILIDPNLFLSISFQLSFLATIGVMVLAPELTKILSSFPSLIKEDLSVTLCAQLLITPIIAVNFGTLSLVGLLVNTLVLWTIPLIMISGIFSVLAYLLFQPFGAILSLVPYTLITYFDLVIGFLDIKEGSINLPKYSAPLWIGYYLVVFGLFLFLKKRNTEQKEEQILPIPEEAVAMVS